MIPLEIITHHLSFTIVNRIRLLHNHSRQPSVPHNFNFFIYRITLLNFNLDLAAGVLSDTYNRPSPILNRLPNINNGSINKILFWRSFNLKVTLSRETSSWIASGTDCFVYAAETVLRTVRLILYNMG